MHVTESAYVILYVILRIEDICYVATYTEMTWSVDYVLSRAVND